MIDWIKEVNNEKYWMLLVWCQSQLHHAPCLNEDVNEDCEPHGEQDKTSRLTQTHHQRQDRHLHADSKHLHHLLRQDKTESIHHNEHNKAIGMDWARLEK